ncbi:hypothetical protein [uncultured Candidatus Kuenenia sp.]|uniref:hypothetical protein n=1 Tax=uncultured Candidatus Kuenenia sp. TaxID=1048336 RepID=UPI0025E3CD08|nr:hypothetical protein [uncultured Candidatus Kuenenia sp.]
MPPGETTSIQSPIGTMSSAFPLCCASILNMTGLCSRNCAVVHTEGMTSILACHNNVRRGRLTYLLFIFLQNVIELQDGMPGVVLSYTPLVITPKSFMGMILKKSLGIMLK